jgi:DNA-binding NarL/FixJ family response regulator
MDKRIRVVILEDHQSTIDGYQFRLINQGDIEIVSTIGYGEELEPTLAAHYPVDVLILDIEVPTSVENGRPYPILFLLPRVLERYPMLKALVISMYGQPSLIRMVSESGASGFVLKDDQATQQQLGSVIRTIAAGGIHYSKEAHQKLLSKTSQVPALAPRQVEVLALCAAYPDKSTSEIASLLGLADGTVRTLLSHTYVRMGVGSRVAAVARAEELGLIATPSKYPVPE